MADPVLLLTIDTLRRDRFTKEYFPETWQVFSSDFANFTNAYSHGNSTPLAFPGIITSYPVRGNGQFYPDAQTVAEQFSANSTSGFSNNAHLTPERGYDRGFDLFHDLAPPDTNSIVDRLKQVDTLRDSELVAHGYRFYRKILESIRNPGTTGVHPFPNPKTTADVVSDFVIRRIREGDSFIWGHYMDPHKPFHPDQGVGLPDERRSYEEIEYLNSYEHSKNPLPENDIEYLERLYESNIRYLDRELTRLFDLMKQTGTFEDSLIIVAGDHGELFGEHGLMFHPMDVDPVDELLQIPLLVKYPGNEDGGSEYDHLTQHGDILPTIIDQTEGQTAAVSGDAYLLRDTTSRHVISKSNTAVRISEGEEYGIKRRDGSSENIDALSDAGRELIETEDFAEVRNTSGDVKGVKEAERNRQLDALGYK